MYNSFEIKLWKWYGSGMNSVLDETLGHIFPNRTTGLEWSINLPELIRNDIILHNWLNTSDITINIYHETLHYRSPKPENVERIANADSAMIS